MRHTLRATWCILTVTRGRMYQLNVFHFFPQVYTEYHLLLSPASWSNNDCPHHPRVCEEEEEEEGLVTIQENKEPVNQLSMQPSWASTSAVAVHDASGPQCHFLCDGETRWLSPKVGFSQQLNESHKTSPGHLTLRWGRECELATLLIVYSSPYLATQGRAVTRTLFFSFQHQPLPAS